MADDYAEDDKNTLYDNGKVILLRIIQKCKEESASGLRIPVELYEDRVLDYTGVPKALFDEVAGERRASTLDLFERAVISDCLSKMYSQLRSFTYKDIYEEVKDKVKNHKLATFCRDLNYLGYKHVDTLNYGMIVMEDPKFTFERFRYLSKIKKLRAQSHRRVYYLDERIIDRSRTFKKPWTTEDMTNVDGYIFFHVVSKYGFEKGLFCNQATCEDLTRWVSDVVLSYLSASSILIMDQNPLHGERMNGPITRFHSKQAMLSWLHRNKVPCAASMPKAQLYELVARCPAPARDGDYSLDLLLRAHGHAVLRLPRHYHDLSLTELLWEHVGTSAFSDADRNNLVELKKTVLNTLKNITHEKWSQFEATIDATEQEFLAIDEATEIALDPYDIDLKCVNA